ncbi:MAG: bifunctional diaminohydroxyphosphoribosylaminopyrimidine deaminase/5-amino-6-(5-phosphoribosylamino)uracil reductase RibD [Bacteroidales bacterium]|nr:bifunctional diaminohydroxyphosphoribosylaminopyrimidine deaminase/5-amino-6-(5-phosphoribosylamino)uracil reductase RibD [Bacteroidales bacterium]
MHELYMKRCFELASKAIGNTYPNPLVGSVIVNNGKIIGEGYHLKCGLAHAEVNAVNSVKNVSLLKDSTLYVNLEPCSHIGRTPACSSMIIEKEIPRVVISNLDPFNMVNGSGIKMLKNAGVEVVTGILENQGAFLNRRFFTFHKKKRPYIILKWAESRDGFIDYLRCEKNKFPAWITNETSRALVHKWRTEEAAVLVGTNTAEKDNPALTVRDWTGNQPIRMVIDKDLRLSKNLKLFDKSCQTVVFTNEETASYKNLKYSKITSKEDFTDDIIKYCYLNEIQSIIIEGGAYLLSSFIKRYLWDEARIFVGNKLFERGIKAPDFDFSGFQKTQIGDSQLFIGYRTAY